MNAFPSNISNSPDIEAKRLQLEKLCQPTRITKTHWLRQAGQWLLKSLTAADQPHIRTQTTHQGTVWHVQDPIDGMHHTFDSEAALRVWLEQRHVR